MELRHLRYFVTVAEELHFSRAALRLHIGQPPLSQQIQALEAELGCLLFERTKRNVRLTEAGRIFLLEARRILALSEQAVEMARRAQRGEIGELRIGFTSLTPLTELFSHVINAYRERYPNVSVKLREMSTLKQIDAIERRELDMGFIRTPEVAIPSEVKLTPLRDDPLMLVLPNGHPLADRPVVSVPDLEGVPFVMYSESAGTGIHPRFVRLCRQHGFVPTIAQEAREAATIIGLVAAGFGISLLPTSFRSIQLRGICYRPLSGAGAATLMLAEHGSDHSPLVAAFIALALDMAERERDSGHGALTAPGTCSSMSGKA